MNNNNLYSIANKLLLAAEDAVQPAFRRAEQIAKFNQRRVLEAFWAERVSEADLHGSTGYGLGDDSRDKLERVYARVFQTEGAIVRPQIVSGTHALRLGLFGVLRPGHHLLFATGNPYDTLEAVVGIRLASGSLAEWGVTHAIVPLKPDGTIDIPNILDHVTPQTKVIMFQKSRGYQNRPALTNAELGNAFERIRAVYPSCILVVDNCYGEFVEESEPTAVGADLAIGSLIKNPGGGVASTGGYVVGKQAYIEQVGAGLIAPGVGLEAGPTHDFMRSFYQGLFLAPHVVCQAVKGSILASRVFSELGLPVQPSWDVDRADLIVATEFGTRERLLAFCKEVQRSAPIDAHVVPDAADMPGYESAVVMAAGAFVQGASLEMSADGPMRPPFTGYLQGGLTYEHVYLALERITAALLDQR